MTTRTETKTTALNSFLPRRGAPYDDPTGGQFLGGNPQRLTKWQRLQSTADPRGAAQTAYWYEVTRADDDEEPGSLRYGLQKLAKQGPLTILFANEVDRIELAGSLNIKHGDLTIDGSTSKGGVELTGFDLEIKASNVIVRHLAVRPGCRKSVDTGVLLQDPKALNEHEKGKPPQGWKYAALDCVTVGTKVDGTIEGVVLDHLSLGFSTDDLVDILNAKQVWVQWCLLHHPLDFAGHIEAQPDGEDKQHKEDGQRKKDQKQLHHSKGMMVSSDSTDIYILHNFLAHTSDRAPKFSGLSDEGALDSATMSLNWNVFYDNKEPPSVRDTYTGKCITLHLNNNFYKQGPTSSHEAQFVDEGDNNEVLAAGNTFVDRDGRWVLGDRAGGEGVEPIPERIQRLLASPDGRYRGATFELSGQLAAGAWVHTGETNASVPWVRADIDRGLVHDFERGTGQLVDRPCQAGGPVYTTELGHRDANPVAAKIRPASADDKYLRVEDCELEIDGHGQKWTLQFREATGAYSLLTEDEQHALAVVWNDRSGEFELELQTPETERESQRWHLIRTFGWDEKRKGFAVQDPCRYRIESVAASQRDHFRRSLTRDGRDVKLRATAYPEKGWKASKSVIDDDQLWLLKT